MTMENNTSIVWDLEKKLNFRRFWDRTNKKEKHCSLTVAQYWDWMTYIDDDYLTQWEVLRMQELYYWQVQELMAQGIKAFALGYGITWVGMGPVIKSGTHGKFLRFPVALVIA
jgi:hypothetical protein